VSRVLINDMSACEGDGTSPAACLGALSTSNLTDITFGL